MHSIQLRDISLAYRDAGSGPVLLLVHGFPIDSAMWRHQIDHFSLTHRVIAPDLRGFGESGVSTGTVTMGEYAADLDSLIEKLAIKEPIVFCGLSMGGYIAWQFALNHASRLRALIVCDTRAAADSPEAAGKRIETAIKLESEGTSFIADVMLPKFYTENELTKEPVFVRETREMIMRTNPFGAAAASRGMGVRPDVTAKLATIKVPTLVICGEHDAISPPKEMRSIAAAMPNATYAEIPGAGHMAPLQSPEKTNAAMMEFLTGL